MAANQSMYWNHRERDRERDYLGMDILVLKPTTLDNVL